MWWGIKAAACVAMSVGCVVFLAPQALAAGFSDSFSGRETVSGLPLDVSGSNLGATQEAGDPHAKPFSPGPSFVPAGHSVWVEWEATATEYVTVSLCASGVPPVLGIYEPYEQPVELGHLSELHAGEVGQGPGCTPIEYGFTFKAVAGRKYEIFIDGDADPFRSGPKEGPISMRIEATPRPANDDFSDAVALAGRFESEHPGQSTYSASRPGYTWAASRETGEPVHGANTGGASVWYQWTAPESGTARISLGDRPSIRFAVYRGESLDSLEQLLAGPEYGELPVVGGTSYRIAVDGALSEGVTAMSTFNLTVSMYKTAPAPSDPVNLLDRRPPRTIILSRRVRSRDHLVTVRFRADEAPVRFRCRLDRGRPRRCSSPQTYARLAEGLHVLRVSAVDAAGNMDPTPAIARFSVPGPQR